MQRNSVQIQTSNLISRNCLFLYYQTGNKPIYQINFLGVVFVSIPYSYCLICTILGAWILSNCLCLNSRKPNSSRLLGSCQIFKHDLLDLQYCIYRYVCIYNLVCIAPLGTSQTPKLC